MMGGPFPEWIRRGWAGGTEFIHIKTLIEDLSLRTVCQSARCPNIGECWGRRTATVMVLGNTCTRNCRYCSVLSGKPGPVDPEEPWCVAEAVARMGLKHVVITSVTRDDLPDGGAGHIAETLAAVRRVNPETTIEVLVPDFQGDHGAISVVLEKRPEVFSHNIETIRRLYRPLRGRRSTYDLALSVLRTAANHVPRAIIKSAFMVGHGERPDEVRATMLELLEAGAEAVSIGQYLRPSKRQRQVVEYVHPDQFEAYERLAYDLGFKFAVAGPFVRSSYRSEEMMAQSFA